MMQPFLALSEGLMAGLASRAHDWTFWSIGETFRQTTPTSYHIAVEVRVQLKKSGLRSLKLSPFDSPSAVLQEIFQEPPSPTAKFSGPGLSATIPANEEAYAPARDAFQRGRSEYRRQKNSRGEFEEFGAEKP